MNAIALNHICKSFGSFAIQDLTLEVPEGTICGLVGENGAGKSTTIRLLMNALRPDSGTAAVLGVDTSSPEFLAVKEDIGVVLDEAYFRRFSAPPRWERSWPKPTAGGTMPFISPIWTAFSCPGQRLSRITPGACG